MLKDNFSHSDQVIKLVNLVHPEGKHKQIACTGTVGIGSSMSPHK